MANGTENLGKKKKILAGVRAADPDALAEWAYCSYYAYGIQFDSQRALERARIAGKNGSILGKALASGIILNSLRHPDLEGNNMILDRDRPKLISDTPTGIRPTAQGWCGAPTLGE